MDDFTEISSQSWGGRILESIKGVVFGFILIAVAVIVLSWNENRSVKTARSLKEGAGAVVDVASDAVNAGNDKKFVHVTGEAKISEPVTDPVFGISDQSLRITRKVEMYQWEENRHSQTKKKLGGGTETETTYSYEKKWSDKAISSSSFKKPEGHANPGGMIAENNTKFYAKNATLGAFKLPESLISLMKGDVTLSLDGSHLASVPAPLKDKTKLGDGGFYVGKDPSAPEIGDQRVSFMTLKPGTFSVIAQQIGDTFQPYATKAGDVIERAESGTVSASLMLLHAESENKTLTWLLRAGGFVLMAIGIGLIINPLVVVADVIPFLGSLLGAGVFFFSFMFAFVGTSLTIAVAWFVVRPVLSLSLIAGAIAAAVVVKRVGAGKRAAAVKPA